MDVKAVARYYGVTVQCVRSWRRLGVNIVLYDTYGFSDVMRTRDVASIARIPARTIRHMANTGRIPAERTAGGHYRFRKTRLFGANIF